NLAAFENAFRIGAENLTAMPLFVDAFAERAQAERICVVAPDAGALKRAASFAQALAGVVKAEVSTALMEKRRSGGVVTGEAFVGDVQDAHAIIFDDLISTGGTI